MVRWRSIRESQLLNLIVSSEFSKMKRRRNAFSLLEVIAAVVILAVVAAATVATIAPMRQKSSDKLAEQDAATLSGMVQTYYVEFGRYPNFGNLRNEGYLPNVTDQEKKRYSQLTQTFTINTKTGEITSRKK